MSEKIVVAGATGNLGGQIVDALLAKGAEVATPVRLNADAAKIERLREKGARVFQIDANNLEEMRKVCNGADCVVSALSGLREVVIDAQKVLLDATVAAKVPRFIPSDYSIDFTNLIEGRNRNLDWRREFQRYVDTQPIAATSVFNGAFMELLTKEMPLILPKIKRIMHWGDRERIMDFTHTRDVAEFTANVALDNETPRFLHIAGDRVNPLEMAKIVSSVTGENLKTLRVGSVGLLEIMIKLTRKFVSGETELYPPWQGMQYMRDMVEGRVNIEKYDNDRYPQINWTRIEDYLAAEKAAGNF